MYETPYDTLVSADTKRSSWNFKRSLTHNVSIGYSVGFRIEVANKIECRVRAFSDINVDVIAPSLNAMEKSLMSDMLQVAQDADSPNLKRPLASNASRPNHVELSFEEILMTHTCGSPEATC